MKDRCWFNGFICQISARIKIPLLISRLGVNSLDLNNIQEFVGVYVKVAFSKRVKTICCIFINTIRFSWGSSQELTKWRKISIEWLSMWIWSIGWYWKSFLGFLYSWYAWSWIHSLALYLLNNFLSYQVGQSRSCLNVCPVKRQFSQWRLSKRRMQTNHRCSLEWYSYSFFPIYTGLQKQKLTENRANRSHQYSRIKPKMERNRPIFFRISCTTPYR